MTNYGYKVLYKKQGKNIWKIYLITNTYDSALWTVRWYNSHSPPDRKTDKPITNASWIIQPIKAYLEYKLLWRGCPF